jgi:hypothetical protein
MTAAMSRASMGQGRRSGRFGAWLGLIALALQLTLSFGHVHAHDLAQAGLRGHTTSVATQAPAQPAQPSDDDDYCAICASIFLVASSFTPTPPALPVPGLSKRIVHDIEILAAVETTRPIDLRSRAPPIA